MKAFFSEKPMRLGCRTCFHTLYDEKKNIYIYKYSTQTMKAFFSENSDYFDPLFPQQYRNLLYEFAQTLHHEYDVTRSQF